MSFFLFLIYFIIYHLSLSPVSLTNPRRSRLALLPFARHNSSRQLTLHKNKNDASKYKYKMSLGKNHDGYINGTPRHSHSKPAQAALPSSRSYVASESTPRQKYVYKNEEIQMAPTPSRLFGGSVYNYANSVYEKKNREEKALLYSSGGTANGGRVARNGSTADYNPFDTEPIPQKQPLYQSQHHPVAQTQTQAVFQHQQQQPLHPFASREEQQQQQQLLLQQQQQLRQQQQQLKQLQQHRQQLGRTDSDLPPPPPPPEQQLRQQLQQEEQPQINLDDRLLQVLQHIVKQKQETIRSLEEKEF